MRSSASTAWFRSIAGGRSTESRVAEPRPLGRGLPGRSSSWLLAVVVLAGCAREQTPALRRLAILPIDNLASSADAAVDAAALQLAVWDSLQAQPALHAVIAGHRRDLPELQPAWIVAGYVAGGRFHLQLNDQPISCAGTLADCVARITGEIASRVGVTPRPAIKAESLRILAGSKTLDALEKAANSDPGFSVVWLAWAAEAQSRGGVPGDLAVLKRAPLNSMAPFDAARIRLRLAELSQDRTARADALAALARTSPADIELRSQAAQEAAAGRDFVTAAQLFDQLIALAPNPRFLNQAAYVAAFMGDRAKAERYAAAAHTAAPNDPSYLDTRGEIAYFFGAFADASRFFEQTANLNVTFLNGQELWKAADAARNAGDKSRSRALLARYLEFRTKAGLHNTLILQAVWDWSGPEQDEAIKRLSAVSDSTDRGPAQFLLALIALNKRDFTAAQAHRRQLDPKAVEAAFLGSLMDGTPIPTGFPVPPEAIAALRHFLRGENQAALASYAKAKPKIDPFSEGHWRKFEAVLNGRKPQGLLPASPDDWLAVLLR